MRNFLKKVQTWYFWTFQGLQDGDPELVRRIRMLLATDLTVPEIVGKLKFIRHATPAQFSFLFKADWEV